MSKSSQETWGTRLRKRFDSHPVLTVLVVSAIFVSSILTISGAVGDVVRWHRNTFLWREAEYEKLENLRAGYSFDQFEKLLGPAVFERLADDGRLVEHSFEGRDYWVQTISQRRQNTVLLYAVTACSPSFKPSFSVPSFLLSHRAPEETQITLGESSFADVDPVPGRTEFSFSFPATGRGYFHEYFYAAGPAYKSYAWGLNDVCAERSLIAKLHEERLLPLEGQVPRKAQAFVGRYKIPRPVINDSVQRLRREVIVNTYSETVTRFEDLERYFSIGVSHFLVARAAG